MPYLDPRGSLETSTVQSSTIEPSTVETSTIWAKISLLRKVPKLHGDFLKHYETPKIITGVFEFYKTLRLDTLNTGILQTLRTNPLNHRVFRHCESMAMYVRGGSLIVIPIVVILKT